MTKDESVNGPKIAAQILSRMSSEQQERLMKSIESRDKKIAALINKNLISYENISELTSQGVQILIKNIEHKDLVLSLKTASEEVKLALLSNMSERKKIVVEDDFMALPPSKLSEVEESQRRIALKMDELITSGQIRSR